MDMSDKYSEKQAEIEKYKKEAERLPEMYANAQEL